MQSSGNIIMAKIQHKVCVFKEFPAMIKIMFVCHGNSSDVQEYQGIRRHCTANDGY